MRVEEEKRDKNERDREGGRKKTKVLVKNRTMSQIN